MNNKIFAYRSSPIEQRQFKFYSPEKSQLLEVIRVPSMEKNNI
jgi:hypothetical protein